MFLPVLMRIYTRKMMHYVSRTVRFEFVLLLYELVQAVGVFKLFDVTGQKIFMSL
jgi:hypothetical protein